MKRFLSIALSLIFLLSALIIPLEIVSTAEESVAEKYDFSFKKADVYNYSSAKKNDDAKGYLTFTPNSGSESLKIAPLHAPSQYENNWSDPVAEYEEITVDGRKTDSLKVYANNETYLVPIKKDLKPFELKPGTEYSITISYLHKSNVQNDTAKCRGFYAASGLVAPFNVMANKRNTVPLTAFGDNSYLSRPFASDSIDDLSTLPSDTNALITKTVTFKTPEAEGEGYTYDAKNNAYKINVNGVEYSLYNYFFLYFETAAKPVINITALSISEIIPVDETGYTYSFEKDKVYNYIRAKKNDSNTGWLSFTPKNSSSSVKIVPLHAPSQYENNWSDPVAEYEEIAVEGQKTDSLKVYANNETYLIPIKEDGKPFELKPDKEYVVKISYVHSKSAQSDTSKMRGFYAAGGYNAPFNLMADGMSAVPLSAFGENSYLSRPYSSVSIDDLATVPEDNTALITKTVTFKTPAEKGEGYTYDAKSNAYKIEANGTEYTLYNIFYLYFGTYAKPTINITELSINEYVESDEVSVTFVNTLTNEETVVTGKKGEPFTYPADPFDEERKFGGWYYTREYVKPFVVTVFPDVSVKVFSRFIDPPPTGFEDFETYTSNEYTVISNANGEMIKSNRAYFGDMLSICDKAYGGEKSLKYEWDSTMVRDVNDANTYDAAGRYNSIDAKVLLEEVKIHSNTTYVVSFKYFVEKANSEIYVSAASGQSTNIWGDTVNYKYEQPGSHFVVPAFNNDGEWHEGKFVVTTAFKGKGNSLFFIISLPENKDAVLYIDDISFIPLRDDESYIKYDGIATSEIFVGKIGEKLPEYTPSNGKHTFLGWYADADYGAEFDKIVFEEMGITAYAKWNQLPITFDGDFDGRLSTVLLSVENKSGAGNGDDFSLKYTYNGDEFFRYTDDGTPQYFRERYSNPDSNAVIKNGLKTNTVYIINYDVKVNDSNLDVNAYFVNASSQNIWSGLTNQPSSQIVLKTSDKGNGWMNKTVAVKTGDLSYATSLYLYFTVENDLTGRKAEIYVDNILVYEAEGPMAIYNTCDGRGSFLVTGKAGDKLIPPSAPVKYAYDFTGWYLDADGKVKFEETVLKENEIFFVYPNFETAKTIVFDYEKYFVPYTDRDKGIYQRHDCEVITLKGAYSGNHVMKADRSYTENPEFNLGGAGHLLSSNNITKRLDLNKNYIVTFKYYIEKQGQRPLEVSLRAAALNNFWAQTLVSNYYVIEMNEETEKWHTGTLVVSGSKISNADMNWAYVSWIGGNEGMYYIDDFTITEMAEGHMAYFVDNGGCSKIPEYVSGRPGQNFSSQLPHNPVYENHKFLGYYVLNDKGEYEPYTDMTLRNGKEVEIVARFIRLKTVQDFEKMYPAAVDAMPAYNVKDYDYELYNTERNGNSKDNVTSGSYSLKRKGKTQFFENALLLTQGMQLIPDEKYTVTFNVKMTSYLQTDGAVKIVGCNSPVFAWAVYGDYFPVVAVNELTDGTWHQVSYTFTAIEPYVSVQIPGYCEIYIDDVVFTHVDKSTPVSNPVQFTEYVPQKRDLITGEIIGLGEQSAIDIDSIIDKNLARSEGVVFFVIGGAVLILIVAVTVLLIIKKKKGGVN